MKLRSTCGIPEFYYEWILQFRYVSSMDLLQLMRTIM